MVLLFLEVRKRVVWIVRDHEASTDRNDRRASR